MVSHDFWDSGCTCTTPRARFLRFFIAPSFLDHQQPTTISWRFRVFIFFITPFFCSIDSTASCLRGEIDCFWQFLCSFDCFFHLGHWWFAWGALIVVRVSAYNLCLVDLWTRFFVLLLHLVCLFHWSEFRKIWIGSWKIEFWPFFCLPFCFILTLVNCYDISCLGGIGNSIRLWFLMYNLKDMLCHERDWMRRKLNF